MDPSIDNIEASEPNIPSHDVSSSTAQTPKKGLEPFVELLFESMEHAKNYYTEYGRQNGFVIRTRNTQRTIRGQGEPNVCVLVCGREGSHTKKIKIQEDVSQDSVVRRNTSTTRCGCTARMRVQLHEGGWEVTHFEDNHNHKLVTPDKRKYMKTNKNMPKVAKVLAEAFREENIPVGKVAAILDGDNIGFSQRDCWNHLNSSEGKKTKDGDATGAFKFFQKKKIEDPQFFYAIQTDNEGRAVNFFWVDGRSRLQYEHFGDVVIFDTTYKTNVYQMPFGPFTGVNHHWQSIQFGCALLMDEKEESYVWLFETWLQAMGGRYPISIITDQEKSMTTAVAKVLPNTRHRLCLWHIIKHFPEHLSHLYSNIPSFKKDMRDCVNGTFRESDFEKKWEEILLKYDLKDHDWLGKMYQIKEKWVPSYNLSTFYAGMNTTGRSEGMNSVYKNYFTPHTTLCEFLHKNEKCLENIARLERVEDFETEHKSRIVDGDGCLIKHAATLYTRNLYDKFRVEWSKAQVEYKVISEKIEEEYNMYTIRSRNTTEQDEWNVHFSQKTLEGGCECKKLEFMGIPCGHLLKIFIRLDIDEIPNHFIRRRWMQGANKYRVVDGCELVKRSKDSKLLRLCHGSHLANQIVYECAEDDETFKMLVDTLTTLSENITKYKSSHGSQMTSKSSNMVEEPPSYVSPVILLDPNISQTKGRKKNTKSVGSKRIKGGLEISQSKKLRKCAMCGEHDGHDKRNCPDKKKSTGSKKQNTEDTEDVPDDDDEDMEDATLNGDANQENEML